MKSDDWSLWYFNIRLLSEVSKVFAIWFMRYKDLKIQIGAIFFFIKSANFFLFVLQCLQRENVHNETKDGSEAP